MPFSDSGYVFGKCGSFSRLSRFDALRELWITSLFILKYSSYFGAGFEATVGVKTESSLNFSIIFTFFLSLRVPSSHECKMLLNKNSRHDPSSFSFFPFESWGISKGKQYFHPNMFFHKPVFVIKANYYKWKCYFCLRRQKLNILKWSWSTLHFMLEELWFLQLRHNRIMWEETLRVISPSEKRCHKRLLSEEKYS